MYSAQGYNGNNAPVASVPGPGPRGKGPTWQFGTTHVGTANVKAVSGRLTMVTGQLAPALPRVGDSAKDNEDCLCFSDGPKEETGAAQIIVRGVPSDPVPFDADFTASAECSTDDILLPRRRRGGLRGAVPDTHREGKQWGHAWAQCASGGGVGLSLLYIDSREPAHSC